MNQCAKTFVLTGLVVAMLLALHFLPGITVCGKELRHVNILSDVVPEPAIADMQVADVPIPKLPEPPRPLKADTLTKEEGVSDKQVESGIVDYSAGASGGMGHFYSMLAHIGSLDRPVRIAYYGDSFIEGDILTCDLRESLQQRFGGYGVGWVDCCSKTSGFRPTVNHKFGGFTAYDVINRPFSHKHEGISQRYFVPSENAYMSYAATKYKRHSSRWFASRLFLRTESPLDVAVSVNGKEHSVQNVVGSPEVQMLAVCDTMRSVSYRFAGAGSGTFVYGVALESDDGVILDNFSMRGSAGYTLAQIPYATLRDFARHRPYDLIVLHFGLNVLDEKNEMSVYKTYIRRMAKAVENLRRAYPEASILIVSVPDRDQRTADGIKTLKGLEALAAYQQVLASDCKVAYFNMFKAMGGSESMKGMVDKGLANKDYTHLNFAGGRRLAGLLYDAIMDGYVNYRPDVHN